MSIQMKLIISMAAVLLLLLVVTVSIGTWVINTITYNLNTELFSLKLATKIENIEATIKLLADSGASSIPEYVRQAQTEILQEFQEPLAAQAEKYYIITGKERQSLLHAGTGQELNINADVLEKMFKTQAGITHFYHDGATYFTAYEYFDTWDWLIGISLPQQTMFRQRQVYFTTVSSFSLLVFAGVFILAYVTGQRVIVKPLAMLVNVTRAIMVGNFDQPLKIRQHDEIGQLAEAIHKMAQQLRQNFEQIESQLVTIQRDMAEREQAEEEIRQLNAELEHRVRERTAKLEAMNKELQSFAYVVSHDLKAPLRAIARLVHWLVEDYAAGFDAKGKEMADLLVGRVKRMDDLIEGILEYSRIGRIVGHKTKIDVDRLLKDVIDTLAPPPTIRIEYDSKFPTVLGDATRFSQMFQNLIGNAVKFMDKSEGIITIRCKDLGPHWQFNVSDNGPGIDEKYHKRIFEIFQTLKPRDEEENTGVGLSIVKKIVEFYGGKIWVESTVGMGTSFYFTIPKT